MDDLNEYDFDDLTTDQEWWSAFEFIASEYSWEQYNANNSGYSCVKECPDGWGIWPAYDMCVPCVAGCKRCDGYPKKEYSELIETYGKNTADEIMQGYTYLSMMEYGPLMTTDAFVSTCSKCDESLAWDPETNMCTDDCSNGYRYNEYVGICQVDCGIPGCLVCRIMLGSDHCEACQDPYTLQGGRCVCDNQSLYPSELFTSNGSIGRPCDPCPAGYVYKVWLEDTSSVHASVGGCVCPDGFTNNNSANGSCQKSCGSHEYALGVSCSTCDVRCDNCSAGGGYHCTSCDADSKLVIDAYGSYCKCKNPSHHKSLLSGKCESCRDNYTWNEVFEYCVHNNSQY